MTTHSEKFENALFAVCVGDTVQTPAGNTGIVEDVYRKRFIKVSGLIGYFNVESLRLVERAKQGLFKGPES